MGTIFFGLAALFFFFAVADVTFLKNPTAWGLLALALGALCGDWKPWRKA